MKIYTRLIYDIASGELIDSASFEYDGPVDLCCGATSQQTDALNQQSSITKQLMTQGQQIFGNSSGVFNDLVSSLAPTVAAGPNQEGFSQAEQSALNSKAITNSGVAYKNAAAAVGNAQAAQNGGNVDLTSGAQTGVDANLAESASENTADQLNSIQLKNYETGRQNYDTAVSDLTAAPSVFSPATTAGSAESGAAADQANTANQIAQQNNSWVQGVTGALGGIASGAVGGYLKGLGNRGSGSGGGASGSDES